MKKIVINSCMECPNKEHRGGFATIPYIPFCNVVNKDLPYAVIGHNNSLIASPTGEIPDWCPLEDNNDNSNPQQ